MAEIKSYPNNVDEEIGAENVMRWHHGRTSGVYGAVGELVVAALSTPGMAVTVSDGGGWLTDASGNGIHFWNDRFAATAALLQLSIDTADGVLNRIDRVIVEWSTPNYTQLPEIKILKGTSAVSPVAPSLTNSASLRQISLARIAVAAGTLAITAGMITDERFEPSVCGIVTETTVVDTSGAAAQFNEVLGEAQQLVNDLQGEAVIDHAATHEPGGDDETKFVYYGGAQSLTDAQKAQAAANMGAALLENGVVKASQAKCLMEFPTASFTLSVTQAEKTIFVYAASESVVTLPAGSDIPNGASFTIVRWGSGAVSFAAGSGATICASNGVSAISAQYAAALATKVNDTTWWLICG